MRHEFVSGAEDTFCLKVEVSVHGFRSTTLSPKPDILNMTPSQVILIIYIFSIIFSNAVALYFDEAHSWRVNLHSCQRALEAHKGPQSYYCTLEGGFHQGKPHTLLPRPHTREFGPSRYKS